MKLNITSKQWIWQVFDFSVCGIAIGMAVTWLLLMPSPADLEQTALSLVPDGFGSVTISQQKPDLILGGAQTAMVRAVRPGTSQDSAVDVDLSAVAREAGLALEEEEQAPNGRLVTAVGTGTVAYMSVRGDLVDGEPTIAFAVDVRRSYGADTLWPIPVGVALGALGGAVFVAARRRG